MAVGRAVSAPQCISCQRSVLAAFLAGFGIRDPQRTPSTALRQPARFKGRPFSVYTRPSLEGGGQTTRSYRQESRNDLARPTEDVSALRGEDAKPWYLQLEQEEESPSPLAQRHSIPQLPEDPPPVLEPLLQYLSIEAGLDHLSMFDLRSLDPPPALGANLIMIFGTARSERHLHASADRFCSWLRTEHKLKPHADGLLGRTEIKLRMKRKARRSRIMSAAGGIDRKKDDDSMQTGWVCVNVGEVDAAPGVTTSNTTQQNGFVGFGRRGDGVKVVVQMLTDEKRGDVDLETLWKDILNRAEKRKRWSSPIDIENSQGSESPAFESVQGRSEDTPALPMSDAKSNVFARQTRQIHTTSRRQDASRIGHAKSPIDDMALTFRGDESGLRQDADRVSRSQDGDPLTSYSTQVAMRDRLHVLTSQTPRLRRKLDDLKRLPRSEALAILGQGAQDRDSTAFLREFHNILPAFRSPGGYACQLELQAYAIALEHPCYDKDDMVNTFRDMTASGLPIERNVFLYLLHNILLLPHAPSSRIFTPSAPKLKDPGRVGITAFRFSLILVFEVLEKMESLGHSIIEPDIFTMLHLAINNIQLRRPTNAVEYNLIPAHRILQQNYYFREAVNALFPQPHPDSFTVLLLESYARQGDWQAFWIIWENVAIAMRPRTAQMYTALFEGIAASGNIEESRKVLRRWIPGMAREQPKVSVTPELMAAIAQCSKIANVEPGSIS